MKNSFLVYNDISEPIEDFTDEQVGQLFKAMLHYSKTGKALKIEDKEVRTAFKFVKKTMDANAEAYEETCRKRSEAGKKSAELRARIKAEEDSRQESPEEMKRIFEAWNSVNGVTHINGLNMKRTEALKARIQEHGLEKIIEAINRIKKSDFCKGSGDKGWKATFDWFIKPGSIDKILEGNYDNCNKTQIKKGNSFDFEQRNHGADYFADLERKLISG